MKKLIAFLLFLLIIPASVSCLPGIKKWKLVWDANTESDLAGYKAYYSVTSGAFTDIDSYDVGNAVECPLDLLPLVEHTNYYFVVTAYDTSQNESGFSNEVSHMYDQTAPGKATLRLEEIP